MMVSVDESRFWFKIITMCLFKISCPLAFFPFRRPWEKRQEARVFWSTLADTDKYYRPRTRPGHSQGHQGRTGVPNRPGKFSLTSPQYRAFSQKHQLINIIFLQGRPQATRCPRRSSSMAPPRYINSKV